MSISNITFAAFDLYRIGDSFYEGYREIISSQQAAQKHNEDEQAEIRRECRDWINEAQESVDDKTETALESGNFGPELLEAFQELDHRQTLGDIPFTAEATKKKWEVIGSTGRIPGESPSLSDLPLLSICLIVQMLSLVLTCGVLTPESRPSFHAMQLLTGGSDFFLHGIRLLINNPWSLRTMTRIAMDVITIGFGIYGVCKK